MCTTRRHSHGVKQSRGNQILAANVHELRSFLGLAGYYRKFIKDFSKIAEPLNHLTKSDVVYAWADKEQEAFEALKRALSTAPVLQLPNPTLPYTVTTDASDLAIGAVLSQNDEIGERPVAYMSKTLNSTQRRYATYDKEMLAVLEALRIWKPYLASKPFTIVTDHAPLQYLQSQTTLSDRQARWINRLAHFQYTMIHKPGRLNTAADALSRRPHRMPETNTALVLQPNTDFLTRIRNGYNSDSFFTGVKAVLKGERDAVKAMERKYMKQFKLTDGLIYEMRDMEPRLCIPSDKTLRTQILHDHHDTPLAGHLGRDKTLARIKDKFYWPRMDHDIKRYVKTCDTCQRFKTSNQSPAGLLQLL